MATSDRLAIGDRMKGYEAPYAWTLTRRLPVILRIDGRAFHTLTRRKYGKVWSREFTEQMEFVATAVLNDIQGCNFCYCQSDEISFLITDYKTIDTDAWFGYDARKMISISASTAASNFTKLTGEVVAFDSRVFTIPPDDAVNYFVYRQIDATRNAIQMAGREHFSHKQLFKKSCSEIQEMLFQEKGINFDKYAIIRKRGFCLTPALDECIPIFTKNREYVEQHVNIRED